MQDEAATHAIPSSEQERRVHRSSPSDPLRAYLTVWPWDTTLTPSQDTIDLVKRECSSLSDIAAENIALRLRFDGDTTEVVKGVLFRVLPEAWPAAIAVNLPLVHVDGRAETGGEEKPKTWEELRRDGVLLGIEGYTDEVLSRVLDEDPVKMEKVNELGVKDYVEDEADAGRYDGNPMYWDI